MTVMRLEEYTVIDQAAGEIKRSGATLYAQAHHLEPGEALYVGAQYSAKTHWFSGDQPVAYTEAQRAAKAQRPKFRSRARWSNQVMDWIDSRTEQERAEDERRRFEAARRAAYPSVEDQLDMLWHAMDSGQLPRAEPFYSAISAAKTAVPKEKK